METKGMSTKEQETAKNNSENIKSNATESTNVDDGKTENSKREKRPEEWMIRGSATYADEYDECSSIRGRFHQYFIFGEFLDCSAWKNDISTCKEWETTGSDEAYNKLLESEKIRRRQRLIGHISNDIWEKRESPPEDWNKPLPEAMQKNLEVSYLAMKQAEHEQPNLGGGKKSCVLL